MMSDASCFSRLELEPRTIPWYLFQPLESLGGFLAPVSAWGLVGLWSVGSVERAEAFQLPFLQPLYIVDPRISTCSPNEPTRFRLTGCRISKDCRTRRMRTAASAMMFWGGGRNWPEPTWFFRGQSRPRRSDLVETSMCWQLSCSPDRGAGTVARLREARIDELTTHRLPTT